MKQYLHIRMRKDDDIYVLSGVEDWMPVWSKLIPHSKFPIKVWNENQRSMVEALVAGIRRLEGYENANLQIELVDERDASLNLTVH